MLFGDSYCTICGYQPGILLATKKPCAQIQLLFVSQNEQPPEESSQNHLLLSEVSIITNTRLTLVGHTYYHGYQLNCYVVSRLPNQLTPVSSDSESDSDPLTPLPKRQKTTVDQDESEGNA